MQRRTGARDAWNMTATGHQAMFLLACGFALAAWLTGVATSHTFGGWIHVLPLAVLLALAVRVVYALLTLD